VNGGWSPFSPCDCATSVAKRTCSNPVPANGGSSCSGAATKSCKCTDQAAQYNTYPIGLDPLLQDSSHSWNTVASMRLCPYVKSKTAVISRSNYHMTSYGKGYCKEDYLRGWDGKGQENQKACNAQCDAEDDCTYNAYNFVRKGCARYSGSSCTLNSPSDNLTFKKSPKVFENQVCSGTSYSEKSGMNDDSCKQLCKKETSCAASTMLYNKGNICQLFSVCDTKSSKSGTKTFPKALGKASASDSIPSVGSCQFYLSASTSPPAPTPAAPTPAAPTPAAPSPGAATPATKPAATPSAPGNGAAAGNEAQGLKSSAQRQAGFSAIAMLLVMLCLVARTGAR